MLASVTRNGLQFRPWENVASEGQARQKTARKRSLRAVNEHFEPFFNAAWPSAVVFTQSEFGPLRPSGKRNEQRRYRHHRARELLSRLLPTRPDQAAPSPVRRQHGPAADP